MNINGEEIISVSWLHPGGMVSNVHLFSGWLHLETGAAWLIALIYWLHPVRYIQKQETREHGKYLVVLIYWLHPDNMVCT